MKTAKIVRGSETTHWVSGEIECGMTVGELLAALNALSEQGVPDDAHIYIDYSSKTWVKIIADWKHTNAHPVLA